MVTRRPRPRRRSIPMKVKRLVLKRQHGLCKCGCGRIMGGDIEITHYDHEPALALRAVNRRGTDFVPPQHDPAYIDARCPESHLVKTSGTGATTAGTDIGKITKERRRKNGRKRLGPPMPGSRDSRWKIRMTSTGRKAERRTT